MKTPTDYHYGILTLYHKGSLDRDGGIRVSRKCNISATIATFTNKAGFSKNLRVQMGRCPVRAVFPEALDVLAKNHQKLRYVTFQ